MLWATDPTEVDRELLSEAFLGLQGIVGILLLRNCLVRDRPGCWWDQVVQVTTDEERDYGVNHTPLPISLLVP